MNTKKRSISALNCVKKGVILPSSFSDLDSTSEVIKYLLKRCLLVFQGTFAI
ncbi:MAG: hypothetical protein LBQ31_10175 [Bacteroidales bacterium]|nr:hypothetical protein [Bacteroidales bacterium]